MPFTTRSQTGGAQQDDTQSTWLGGDSGNAYYDLMAPATKPVVDKTSRIGKKTEPAQAAPVVETSPTKEPISPSSSRTSLLFNRYVPIEQQEQNAAQRIAAGDKKTGDQFIDSLPLTRPISPEQQKLENDIVASKMLFNPETYTMDALRILGKAKKVGSAVAADLGKDVTDAKEAFLETGDRIIVRPLRGIFSGMLGTQSQVVRFGEKENIPGSKAVADQLEEWSQILAVDNPDITDEFASAAGSSIAFYVPGLAVMKGANLLRSVSPRLALVFGGSASAFLESAAESGGVYDTALKMGASDEEAKAAADRTFGVNALIVGLTNILGPFGPHKTMARRALTSMGTEGLQEFLQQVTSNVNLQRPTYEGTLKSTIFGTILGPVLGVATGELGPNQVQQPASLEETYQNTEQQVKDNLITLNREGVISDARLAEMGINPERENRLAFYKTTEDNTPLNRFDKKGVEDAALAEDMSAAGAPADIAARVSSIIGDGTVRTSDYFGQKAEVVDRNFTIPKMSIEDLKANPPSQLGELKLDPASITNVFEEGGTGIEGEIREPIQIFYDLKTGEYSLQNGYHRLVEDLTRGVTDIKGEIIFGTKEGESFFTTPNTVKVMTAAEAKAHAETLSLEPSTSRLRGGDVGEDQEPTEITKEQGDLLTALRPKQVNYLQRTAKDSVTPTTKDAVNNYQNLAEKGLVIESRPGSYEITPEGRSALRFVGKDLPIELAPTRAANVRSVYGSSYITSTFKGNPVTTNGYVLELSSVPKTADLGRLRSSEMKEEVISRILQPASEASIPLQATAFRPTLDQSNLPDKLFLQTPDGQQVGVDLAYANYFKKKYGSDVGFFVQKGEAQMKPVTVKNVKGELVGMIMPLRGSEAPAPLSLAGSLPRAAVRIAQPSKPSVASDRKGGGGKKPPAPPASSEGNSEPSPRRIRKKPAKQPRPLSETQPARESRLRNRLEQTTDTKAEASNAGIVKFLQEQFKAPIRIGKFRQRALGIFKPRSNVVRLKAALDVPTAAHEIGHYLDQEYGMFRAMKRGGRYIEPYRAELLRMGEETSRKSYTTQERIKEGIAEFVRRYITDPSSLDGMAPNFRTYFEKNIPTEGLRILQEARTANDTLLNESPEYRVKSHISTEAITPPLFDRIRKGIDNIFSAIDDDLFALRQFVSRAEKATNAKVPFKMDPYVLARLTRGMDGKVLQFLAPSLQPFDGTGQLRTDVRSLGSILQDVGESRSDFEAYLVSKRAQDLHKENIKTGITPADADAVVASMEERHPEFAALQKEVVAWNRSLLEYARDRGFLSDAQVKSMTENGDNYVPFFRVIDEITVPGKAKNKFADVSNPFKRIKGSTRQIISPIESMTKNAYVIMSAVERNRVGQAIVALAKTHPDLGSYIEEIPAGSKPIKINVEEVMKKLGIENASDAAGQETITLFVHGSKPNATGENVMMVVQNGKAKYYSVDPMLYRAIANMNAENANIIMRILQKPAATLRVGATLTLEFIGRNPMRDQISAGLFSRGNYIPFFDFIKGLRQVLAKGPGYQQAAAGGAMQASFVSLDRPALQQYVDKLFESRGEKILDYALHPLDALRALSEFGELGTRVGEATKVFNREFDRTGDFEEALTRSAFAARNITIDFARRGWAGQSMNMITAFWNAGIQDATKLTRELTGQEKGGNPAAVAWKAAALITVPSIAFYLISKDDERFKELPRWQKDYFWIIAIPGIPLIRLPKPFLPGLLFGSLATRMLEAKDSGSLRPLRDFFVSLRESALPGVIPTAALPLLEYATNFSFFFGRDIVPQDEQSLLPPDQYGIYTPETYKAIGSALNLSPRKIESLVYGYTAGLGRYATSTLDFLGGKTGLLPEKVDAPNDITQLPFIKAFTISDLATTGESLNDFYELYSRAEKTYMSLNNAVKNENMERAQEIRANNLEDLIFVGPDGSAQLLYNALGTAAETISDLKKERESAITSKTLTSEQKTVQIQEINAAMRMIARQALRATERRAGTVDELRAPAFTR